MLDLTLNDPEEQSMSTLAFSEPTHAPEDEADPAPDSSVEDDAGNTIFKLPGKLGEFPADDK